MDYCILHCNWSEDPETCPDHFVYRLFTSKQYIVHLCALRQLNVMKQYWFYRPLNDVSIFAWD
jgi:hypothetical protein